MLVFPYSVSLWAEDSLVSLMEGSSPPGMETSLSKPAHMFLCHSKHTNSTAPVVTNTLLWSSNLSDVTTVLAVPNRIHVLLALSSLRKDFSFQSLGLLGLLPLWRRKLEQKLLVSLVVYQDLLKLGQFTMTKKRLDLKST